ESLNVETDMAADGVRGGRARLPGSALVVVEDELDRIAAHGEDEALATLPAGEPGSFERGSRLFGQVRECHRVAALLRDGDERGAGEPRQQDKPHEVDPQKEAPAPLTERRRS